MWSEQAHPRAAAGSAGGGQFVAKSGGSAKAEPVRGRAATLRYNGKTGTGYGSRRGDPRVRTLQAALNRLGIRDAHGRPLAVDGKLGPLTTQAITAWQRRNGMRPTGVITPADLAKLTAPRHRKAQLKARTLGGSRVREVRATGRQGR